MATRSKSILTTILLLMALVQGPYFYYFTSGFVKLISMALFGLMGLLLTVLLFIKMVKHNSNNTQYHLIGLMLALVIGISTVNGSAMEYLDFNLRKNERERIVDGIKNGSINPLHINSTFLPISNCGNELDIAQNEKKEIVYIAFYIDRGFIDHASEFLYTTDKAETDHLNTRAANNSGDTVVKKLANNWYRVGY